MYSSIYTFEPDSLEFEISLLVLFKDAILYTLTLE